MKVVVALSGGVDSAVAAALLKAQGHEVIGVHMRNWDAAVAEGRDGCTGARDFEDVGEICRILDIPLRVYNFSAEYWEEVFRPYIGALGEDLNVNPDIWCNARIKFGVLLERVLGDFGDVKMATGHWARAAEEGGRFFLELCGNPAKDQTYFLSGLSEEQLSRAVFPLGDISSKEDVRAMARELGLPVWDKRDSVGICFIGKRNRREFLGNYLEEREGDFVDVESGEVMGRHRGTHLYVLHQRDGLFLRGFAEKYYVCGKDVERNIVYLCGASAVERHLHRSRSRCRGLHWISPDSRIEVGERVAVKVRHSPEFVEMEVLEIRGDMCLLGHENMYVTAPGQSLVFYRGRRCLGMGMYVG